MEQLEEMIMQVLRHVHFADCVVPKVTKQEFLNDINLAMYDFKFTKYYVEKYTPNESKPPKDFTGTFVTCADASANDLEEFSSFDDALFKRISLEYNRRKQARLCN